MSKTYGISLEERWLKISAKMTNCIIEKQEEIKEMEEPEIILEEEVIDAVKKIKLGRALGRDNITLEMLTYTGIEEIK